MSRRHSSSNAGLLTILLFLAAFVLLLVSAYLFFSNKLDNATTATSVSPTPAINAVAPTNTPRENLNFGTIDRGNQAGGLQLFITPQDRSTPIVNQLRAAQTNIRMVMYLLTERDIINELIAARNRGVDVRVMLEEHPFGGNNNTKDVFSELQKAGVNVKYANPVFALTHQKSYVIDDRVTIITTANATTSAFTKNREYGVIDTIPSDVLEVATVFDADWNRTQPDLSRANLVWSPVNSRRTFNAIIDAAQTKLRVACEITLDPQTLARLVAAQQRGVQVQVVTNKPTGPSDNNADGINQLLKGKVEVRYSKLYMHAKLFVADDNIAWLGSENISRASLDQNRELGILISDQAIIGRLRSTFDGDFNGGTKAITIR